MSWYNKFNKFKSKRLNIVKSSNGIGGFMSGLVNKNIDDLPPEEELTNEQREKVRKLTDPQYTSPIDKAKYFLKYPNIVYYSIWDFSKYCEWEFNNKNGWNENAQLIWDKFKEKNKSLPYAMPGLNNIVYTDIINEFSLEDDCVSSIFLEKNSEYPEFFINYLKKSYPDIYASTNETDESEKWKIFFDYISFPSSHNYTLFYTMMSSEKDKSSNIFIKEIYKFILDFEKKDSEIKEVVKNFNNNAYLSGVSNELYEEVFNFLEIVNKNESYIDEYSPLSNISYGKINISYIGQYMISKKSLEKVLSILSEKSSDDYFSINVYDSYELDIDKNGHYLTISDDNDNNEIIDRVLKKVESSTYGSSDCITEAIYKTINIDRRQKPEIFLEWFKKNVNESENKDLFYLNILNNSIFGEITDKASSDIFGMVVHNYEPIEENEYDEEKDYAWDEVLPFNLKVAKEIWSEIPVYVRAKATNVKMWFLLCSGLFPCSLVLKKSMEYPSDAMKVLNGINCIGNSEEIKEKIRTDGKKRETESKYLIKEKWEEFLKETNQKSYKLIDFPRLYEFTQILTDRITGSEEVYFPEKSTYISSKEYAKYKLDEMIIYPISSEKLINYFGESVVDASGFSPNKANGIFFPRFSLSSVNDSIIVYIDRANEIREIESTLVNIIGLKSDTFLPSIGEEGTLWHEVAHAVVDKAIPNNRYYVEDKDNNDEASKWLQSPDELMAIQYGQLRYIWDRLYRFFNSQIPVNEGITEGLVSHLKEDIIEILSWEFQGMEKSKALKLVEIGMDEFEDEVRNNSAMSHQEKVKLLTDLFTEFYMKQFMRGKIEDEISRIRKDIGSDPNEKIKYKEEYKVPETYNDSRDTRDIIISELEKEQDYKLFLENVQSFITNRIRQYGKLPMEYKSYVNRYDNSVIKTPWKLDDLLQLMYAPHMSLYDVDLSSKNPHFDGLIPNSLRAKVDKIVSDEKKLLSLNFREDRDFKPKPVTPDEAEDAGKFMSEMNNEYGEDWMWLANSWYKIYKSGN